MKNIPKKIICSSNASWYLWNFRRPLMHHLQDQGYQIIATSSRDEYTDRLKQEFAVHEMGVLVTRGRNPFSDLLVVWEYLKFYKKTKPDLVLNFTIKPNIYSSMVCRWLHIPCISMITGLGAAFSKNNWLEKIVIQLYRIALKKNNVVVFQNVDDRDLFLKYKIIVPGQALFVPGSGIDTVRFAPDHSRDHSDEVVFLMISRLLKEKGVEDYVSVARMSKEKGLNAKFLLAGPVDEKSSASITMSDIACWQSAGWIDYLGTIEEVVPVFKKADVVVLPTRYREGVPRSLLEAMSSGKPIIATNVSGCRDLMATGGGFLVAPNHSDELTVAIEKMIMLGVSGRREMGDRGRDLVVKKYDQNIVFQEYDSVIKKILG